MTKFANPKRFLSLSGAYLKFGITAAFLTLLIGYVWVFYFTPSDRVQGDVFKILYLHVPMAWFAMGLYTGLVGASFCYLIWRHIVAYHVAWACAVVGIVTTIVCLLTGMIWGKPTWGAWWVWDARLTSVFFLCMTYLIYLVLSSISFFNQKQATVSSVFAIIGGINLPIIKWSVIWWNTLHQPASIMKLSAPSIHFSMLYPLLICAAGWALFCLNCVLLISRARIKKHGKWITLITGDKRA